MQTSTYTKQLLGICAALFAVIIGLSVVLYGSGPRGRLVQVSVDPTATALTQGATMTISFDRPLEQTDYSELVKIQPETKFSVTTNAQSITVSFEQSLRHAADYTITVLPGVRDRSGGTMQDPYVHSFTTTAPRYAYIERNYQAASDEDSLEDAVDDHVMIGQIGSEPERIFSHPEIRSFVASETHLVVVVKELDVDKLYSINLQTREVRSEQLAFEGRIFNLALSPRGQVVLFTVQPDFGTVEDEPYKLFADRVESLDLVTGDVQPLTDGAEGTIRAYDVSINTDGQVALIQDPSQTFYAVSPFNDYEPVIIGSHGLAFGFNDAAQEVVFLDQETFTRYDMVSGELKPIEFDTDRFIHDVSAKNGTVFASSFGRTSSAQSQIDAYASWDADPVTVWSNQTGSSDRLVGFEQSFDNNMLALQLDPQQCQYDTIGLNSQCKTTRSIVYDISTQQVALDVAGFDLTWIP